MPFCTYITLHAQLKVARSRCSYHQGRYEYHVGSWQSVYGVPQLLKVGAGPATTKSRLYDYKSASMDEVVCASCFRASAYSRGLPLRLASWGYQCCEQVALSPCRPAQVSLSLTVTLFFSLGWRLPQVSIRRRPVRLLRLNLPQRIFQNAGRAPSQPQVNSSKVLGTLDVTPHFLRAVHVRDVFEPSQGTSRLRPKEHDAVTAPAVARP